MGSPPIRELTSGQSRSVLVREARNVKATCQNDQLTTHAQQSAHWPVDGARSSKSFLLPAAVVVGVSRRQNFLSALAGWCAQQSAPKAHLRQNPTPQQNSHVH